MYIIMLLIILGLTSLHLQARLTICPQHSITGMNVLYNARKYKVLLHMQ